MKVLFDQGVPVPLRRHLHPHDVDTSAERGWSTLQNGDLLNEAESAGYEVFVTTDRNLKYQQKLAGRRIRILVLTTTSWPRISKQTTRIRDEMEALVSGGYVEVDVHGKSRACPRDAPRRRAGLQPRPSRRSGR